MKEIGLELKTKREENGVSVDEAASDLKVGVEEITNIEEGNRGAFEDVFSLKNLIKEYAKYLGLDGDMMLDSFNEYLFEQTSKISLEDIEEARKEKEEKEKDMKILSPYTKEDKNKNSIIIGIVVGIILLVLCIVGIVSFGSFGDRVSVDSEISYKLGENVNEFSE